MSFTDPATLIVSDPTVLKLRVVAYLETYMPAGWRLEPGNLDDLIIEAVCQEASLQADVVAQKLTSDFRYFGTLVNVPPIDAAPASAAATFTLSDTAGHTVPAGTVVGIMDDSGTLQAFDLSADVVVPAASSSGVGTVTAEISGTDANSLSGTAQLITVPSFVVACTLAASTGGVDAELDSVYLGRLTETLQLLTPEPIIAPNFAVLARSVPGVFRATAVDNLKPGPPYDGAAEATGQEKCVTVAVTDVAGASVGSTVRGNVTTLLQSLRETNFKAFCVDPQYSSIDVTSTAFSWPGWDTTDVHARVITALQAFLSPATAQTDPTGNAARWASDPIIRLSELHQTIMSVQGVRYVSPLTFCLHGGSLATTDVTLGAGSAIPALPTSGTLTITVTGT